jgi:chaperonin GroES
MRWRGAPQSDLEQKEKTMKFRPLHDRILVERVAEETKSAGGILIPDNAREKPQQGLVEAVGPGATLDNGTVRAPSVKKGDRILFGKYSGSELKLDGKEYVIMREEDVMAVLK